MAYIFGDSFDLYASTADLFVGYWDSGTSSSFALSSGRFGGQSARASAGGSWMIKSSGSNDAVHHIVCAFQQNTAPLTGTTAGVYLQLSDGATNQCCIVFRQDGTILLTSATPGGTVLATYTGAVTLLAQWFAFEFEVVIHPTAGRFRVRKNGNTSDDFDSGAVLNTRPGANSYANKLTLGQGAQILFQLIDDLLWRSDASSVPFVGDVRCYTRMPASDASVQFSRPTPMIVQPFAAQSTNSANANYSTYTLFTALVSGSLSGCAVNYSVAYTGNTKCALFAAAGTSGLETPGVVIQSATAIVTNPAAGYASFAFSPPIPIVKGTKYYIGTCIDTTSVLWVGAASAPRCCWSSATTYAAWPVNNQPSVTFASSMQVTYTLSPSSNYEFVNETQQDSATSYVYSSNVGDTDLYNIASIGATPTSVIAVTTRAFLQKSDAGSRSGKAVLKSGSATVDSGSATLSTTWAQMWRTDTVDPNTSAPWTANAVNNVQIGQSVSA